MLYAYSIWRATGDSQLDERIVAARSCAIHVIGSESFLRPVARLDRASGFEQRELITTPSLPDLRDWETFTSAPTALKPSLSRNHASDRCKKSLRTTV